MAIAERAMYDEQVKAVLRRKSVGALVGQQHGLRGDKTPQAIYMATMVAQVVIEKTYTPEGAEDG